MTQSYHLDPSVPGPRGRPSTATTLTVRGTRGDPRRLHRTDTSGLRPGAGLQRAPKAEGSRRLTRPSASGGTLPKRAHDHAVGNCRHALKLSGSGASRTDCERGMRGQFRSGPGVSVALRGRIAVRARGRRTGRRRRRTVRPPDSGTRRPHADRVGRRTPRGRTAWSLGGQQSLRCRAHCNRARHHAETVAHALEQPADSIETLAKAHTLSLRRVFPFISKRVRG
jgi:hypothetical protein